jgi:hypothetical protein
VKIQLMTITSLCLAACGGSGSRSVEPAATEVDDDELGERYEPTSDIEPEEPPVPPPPQHFAARAELVAVKGTKMKPAAVAFFQTEGEAAQVQSDSPFEGLKPGTYHLVIHEGEDCGKNAAGAGPAWSVAADVALQITVTKKAAGSLEEATVELMLEGEDTIIGRTLVLHADKKGSPGKAVACGLITTAEPDDAEAD